MGLASGKNELTKRMPRGILVQKKNAEAAAVTERDIMRLFEEYDGEVSLSDFSLAELEEMLGYSLEEIDEVKKKYFDFYDDVKSPSLPRQDW